jgi:hypothetical protein
MKILLRKIVVFILLTTCVLFSLVGCSNKIGSYDDLLNKLKSSKLEVEKAGNISQVFFSVEGRIIKIDNEDIQVFEYPDKSKADSDIVLISADGSTIGTNMITWVSDPHFYRTDKLLILYIGTNEEIIELLNEGLGPQFAGR